jgi:hypothetical protein
MWVDTSLEKTDVQSQSTSLGLGSSELTLQWPSNLHMVGWFKLEYQPLASIWSTDGSHLVKVSLAIFDFMMVWQQYVLSWNHTSCVEFCFPQLVIRGPILSHNAGQPQVPISRTIKTRINPHCTVCCVVSVFRSRCWINYTSYSTLHCGTGSVLDDFV